MKDTQNQFLDWDDDENQQKALKLQAKDVSKVKEVTLSFAIFSGTNKDYYLSCEIRYKG